MAETIHEKHLVSDFMVYWTSPSVIVPGTQAEHSAFCCPVCKTQHPRPEHGKPTVCAAHCGASWTAWGNGLDLSYTKPETCDERPTEFLQRVFPILTRLS